MKEIKNKRKGREKRKGRKEKIEFELQKKRNKEE